MHERFMQHRATPKVLNFVKWSSLVSAVYFLLHFIAYHRVYVNNGSILQEAIENQLLFARTEAYRTMPYSEVTGQYNFCNLKTFSTDDTQGLQNYALNNTSIPAQEISTKTADQLIKELKMEKCIFDRDDIFTVIIVKDSLLASELKQLNRDKYSRDDGLSSITDSMLLE
jgi:hypothetical protein